jgi:hypothetical protein
MSRKSDSGRPPIEAALRHLARKPRGAPVDYLRLAIERPQGDDGVALSPLTESTAPLASWTAAERAHAVWQVIREGVDDPDVSGRVKSRCWHALRAAFRLPDDDVPPPWGSSLTTRFKQLKTLTDVFGYPAKCQPMEMAWKSGVGDLTAYLEQRLQRLRDEVDWEPYRKPAGLVDDPDPSDRRESDEIDKAAFKMRPPSPGAQPIFVDLFVTTVFMKKRAVHRRITERIVTAQEDGVKYYVARGFRATRDLPERTYTQVRALWGCRDEFVPAADPDQPAVSHLWFPRPLTAGQQAHFASEFLFDPEADPEQGSPSDRRWIDVDIDHHGIAPGALLYGDQFPIRGLTIRIVFDQAYLPEAVWWYAEVSERERYDRPPAGDVRLIKINGNSAQKTFTEQPCQPREHYGISFMWPNTHPQ